jgi:succinoglycan biosynthesis transport protein ExoP
MDLEKYIKILWRRKWVVLVTMLITTLVVYVGAQFYSFPYEATTTLRVATSRTGQASYEDLLYADRLLKTFAEIALTSSVEEELVREYGLKDKPEINVQVLPNTELIRITIAHPNPIIARDLANSLAAIVINRSQELDNRLNVITIIDPAVIPDSPSGSRMIIMAAGGLIGLVGGFGLVFLFEYLDGRLHTSKKIEEVSGLSLLGKIPPVKKKQSIIRNKNSPRFYEEAFRILRTNLLMQNHRNLSKVLLITSADPGDGKSTILVNLAFSLAQTGHKVLMVDGDMRKPKLHTLCEIPNQIGLSNILEGDGLLEEALQLLDANISVITSGPPPADPASLLMPDNIANVMEELRSLFDFILVDSPSILAVPDGRLIAPYVDGLILVINKTTTTKDTIQEVNKYLEGMPAKTLGMVINKAELNHGYYYYQR